MSKEEERIMMSKPVVIYTQEYHCHASDMEPPVDHRARRKLIVACVLSVVFITIEILGGVVSNSLAIATDAAHILTDLASYVISLVAMAVAKKSPSKRMTFGWYREEIIGAVVSVMMIWVVTCILFYMAIHRVIDTDYDIDSEIMLITSSAGVVFNIIMLSSLHQHSHGHSHGGHGHSHDKGDNHKSNKDTVKHEGNGLIIQSEEKEEEKEKKHRFNINVHAAFIHVIGDIIQSVGVLIAAIIIYFKPDYKLADPICTFIFSILVLATTVNILRQTFSILLEAAPPNMSHDDVARVLQGISGVKSTHNLRVWSLTNDRAAVAVHLALDRDVIDNKVVQHATELLRKHYEIQEITIQTEPYVISMRDCRKCQDPPF